jgi:hypothetical protein
MKGFSWKQDATTLAANFARAEKLILPNVLESEGTAAQQNGNVLAGWLYDHRSDSAGVADGSTENFLQAFAALNPTGTLKWKAGHAPKKLAVERAPRREIDPLGIGTRHNAIVAAAQAKELDDATKIIDACRQRGSSFTGQSHSISYAGRETLAKALDAELAKTPKPNLVRAQEIEKIMRQTAKECHR